MCREWSLEELIESWTLVGQDWTLVGNKTGATRLGFALLLKFFEIDTFGSPGPTGPVFRSVDRHGRLGSKRLSDRAVADMVKRRSNSPTSPGPAARYATPIPATTKSADRRRSTGADLLTSRRAVPDVPAA